MLAGWGIHELSISQIKQSSYVMLILGILKLHTLSETRHSSQLTSKP